MAMRDRGDAAFTARRSSPQARQFGVQSGLIEEDKLAGIKIGLALDPALPFRGDVGSLLFGGMRSLFLCVIRRRSKKRQIVEMANRLPASRSSA